MDARTYTLIVIAVLCVVFALLALSALSRYRRAVRQARQAAMIEDDGREAYLGTAAEHTDDVFAVVSPGAAPRARVHVRPESVPEVHRSPDGMRPPATLSEVATADVPWSPMAPTVQASAVSTPGYSLADELERLMDAADAQTPLLSAEEHAAVVTDPETEPHEEPTFEQPPAVPPLAHGQVLSAPTPEPAPVPAPEPGPTPAFATEPERTLTNALEPEPAPASALESESAPAPTLESESEPAPDVPEYRLVAPVELHFTGGGGRVGVRPGSRTYDEFQRLAAALLDRGTQH